MGNTCRQAGGTEGKPGFSPAPGMLRGCEPAQRGLGQGPQRHSPAPPAPRHPPSLGVGARKPPKGPAIRRGHQEGLGGRTRATKGKQTRCHPATFQHPPCCPGTIPNTAHGAQTPGPLLQAPCGMPHGEGLKEASQDVPWPWATPVPPGHLRAPAQGPSGRPLPSRQPRLCPPGLPLSPSLPPLQQISLKCAAIWFQLSPIFFLVD